MKNENSIGVYRIVLPDGSIYIGMTTVSFSERWKAHRKDGRLGRNKCMGLRRAFALYDSAQIIFEVLEEMNDKSEAEILIREKHWWEIHKAWGVTIHNGCPSGNGSVRHTESTRERISESVRLKRGNTTGISKRSPSKKKRE